MSDIYDQDEDNWQDRMADADYEAWVDRKLSATFETEAQGPLSTEDALNLSLWEQELQRKDYYDWFLQEVTT